MKTYENGVVGLLWHSQGCALLGAPVLLEGCEEWLPSHLGHGRALCQDNRWRVEQDERACSLGPGGGEENSGACGVVLGEEHGSIGVRRIENRQGVIDELFPARKRLERQRIGCAHAS